MDSEACTPGTPCSPLSPATPIQLKENVCDYYRIVIMSDSPVDNSEIITSFSNPNYTLSNDDALNSNQIPPTTQYYDSEVDTNLYEDIVDIGSTNGTTTKSRAKYANTDITNMGVGGALDNQSLDSVATYDTVASPAESEGHFSMDSCVTSPDGLVSVEHSHIDTEDESPYSEIRGGFTGFYATAHESRTPLLAVTKIEEQDEMRRDDVNQPLLSDKDKLHSDIDATKDITSPGCDSNDSGIQADASHVRGPVNEDIYAVVDKHKKTSKSKEEKKTEKDVLPPGWEKHEDEDGAYYWHIKSGTIQRDPPPPPSPSRLNIHKAKPSTSQTQETNGKALPESPSEDLLSEFEGHAFKYASHSLKSLKTNRQKEEKSGGATFPIKFAVRSLGWVEIAEEDLTPERSSKAVNKCIVDLSLGRNDINDVVGRWGDGKDLYMDLDEANLTLSDPTDMSLLNVQPIQSIRVWGVGRDNGRERDFAYVARDRVTRRHMCHVFRCDTPARQIANTLRDICKKIMMEQSLQQGMQALKSVNASSANRPNHLPNLEKQHAAANGQKITFQDLIKNTSFPTPMEEPKKILKCHYLGTIEVSAPTGVDVLNNAMEKVYARVAPEKWMYVDVAVAPSIVTITEHGKPENILSESRVRFLSFMGIAQKNVKLCSYISHTAQDTYIAHVFHCEPSAGAVCKTIEAACKLRYQKCLDAHHKQMQSAKHQQASQQQNKGFGASLKSVFGGISKGKKAKS